MSLMQTQEQDAEVRQFLENSHRDAKEHKVSLPRHRSQGLQAEASQVPGAVLLLLEPPVAAVHHVLQGTKRPQGV